MTRSVVIGQTDASVRHGLGQACRSPRELLLRFRDDQSGNYAIVMGLTLPLLVGSVGLGTEVGLWYHKHRNVQGAADTAAYTAAVAYTNSQTSNLTVQAQAVTASYGYVAGAKGVTVIVNRPPKSGAYTATLNAIEVRSA